MLGKTDIKRKRKMKGPAESSHAVGSHLLQQLLLQLHTRGKTLRCCCSCFLQPTEAEGHFTTHPRSRSEAVAKERAAPKLTVSA